MLSIYALSPSSPEEDYQLPFSNNSQKDSWMENNISYETRVETWDSGNLLGGVLGTIVCPCLLAIELSVVQFTTSNYHFDTENVSHT